MDEVTEYIIVDGIGYTELQNKVNAKIKEGWQPFGGVACMVVPQQIGSYISYSQAMVMYDK